VQVATSHEIVRATLRFNQCTVRPDPAGPKPTDRQRRRPRPQQDLTGVGPRLSQTRTVSVATLSAR